MTKISDWTIYTPDRNYHVFLELRNDVGVSGWGAAFSERGQVVGALGWPGGACCAPGSTGLGPRRPLRWCCSGPPYSTATPLR